MSTSSAPGSTYKALSAPFPQEMERTLNKGGARLTYVPQAEVIARLNNVLGVENWSLEVINVWRDPSDQEFVLAHARLTAAIDGKTIYRDGFGGQKINMSKNGGPVDLGDDYKGAVSDAMKKAATTLGVGLYLARDDDALEIEAAEQYDQSAPAEVPQAWANFMSVMKNLDDNGKAQINKFWEQYSGGRPKPTLNSHTDEDLEALCGEAVRLTLEGQYVSDPS